MIRIETSRGWRDERRLLAAECDLQPRRDRLGDLVLDREDIGHLAVVPLRPQMVSIGHLHELDADPQPVPRLAHAALEHRRYLELGAHFGQLDRWTAERERRGPRRDPQPG